LDKELYGEGYAYIALGDWFGKWLIILYWNVLVRVCYPCCPVDHNEW
jgi:hypothetical protein